MLTERDAFVRLFGRKLDDARMREALIVFGLVQYRKWDKLGGARFAASDDTSRTRFFEVTFSPDEWREFEARARREVAKIVADHAVATSTRFWQGVWANVFAGVLLLVLLAALQFSFERGFGLDLLNVFRGS